MPKSSFARPGHYLSLTTPAHPPIPQAEATHA